MSVICVFFIMKINRKPHNCNLKKYFLLFPQCFLLNQTQVAEFCLNSDAKRAVQNACLLSTCRTINTCIFFFVTCFL